MFQVQETRIGYVDVKHSDGVLFILTESKMRSFNSTFNSGRSHNVVPILFAKEDVNIGGGMNFNTAVFTAPRSGLYQFHYSEYYSNSSPTQGSTLSVHNIYLTVNKQPKSLVPILPAVVKSSPASRPYDGSPVKLESLLMLKIGDQVELVQNKIGETAFIPSSTMKRFALYSGRLIEEESNF